MISQKHCNQKLQGEDGTQSKKQDGAKRAESHKINFALEGKTSNRPILKHNLKHIKGISDANRY